MAVNIKDLYGNSEYIFASTFSPRHTTVENLSSPIFDSNPGSPRIDLIREFDSKIVDDK